MGEGGTEQSFICHLAIRVCSSIQLEKHALLITINLPLTELKRVLVSGSQRTWESASDTHWVSEEKKCV